MVTKPAHSSRGIESTTWQPGPAATVRVLLVDSRPIILSGLVGLIDRQKPRMQVVGQATSYARGLYLAEQFRPHVVLLSFFPDPLDTLEALGGLLRIPGTKVLLLKGVHESLPVGRALKLGAAGVVIAEDPTESIVKAVLQAQGAEASSAKVWMSGLTGLVAASRRRNRKDDSAAKLTTRERQLIRTIMTNPTAKYLVIGAQLGISEHTVHNHLSSIYHKLDLVNRTDLLVYAVRNSIDEDGDDTAASGWPGVN